MTLAHARTLLGQRASGAPASQIEDHDPARDREFMRRLAEWAATRYAPIVSPDPCSLDGLAPDHPDFCPDGLVMDISGCERLFKGEDRLGSHVAASLRRLGFECRIGIAPTIGAAWAVARFGMSDVGCGMSDVGTSIIPSPAAIRSALAALPIAGLRITREAEEALLELGVERIDQLLALPRAALPSRFGSLLVLRIDHALGQAMETIEPVRPTPPLRVERRFDGPATQQEAIERCTQDLLEELGRELLRRENGVRTLEARFERVGRTARGTEIDAQRLTLSRPTRSPRHLWSLLRPRVEKLHLGFGIEGIALVTIRTGRLRHRQMEQGEHRHRSAASQRRDIAELIDTLVNRLGSDRVLRSEPAQSHIPERSWRMAPAGEDSRERPRPCEVDPSSAVRRSRPSVLFDRPEPAEALALSDRPPWIFRWRDQHLTITAGIGPQRLAGEWWKQRPGRPEEWERDYFRVRDQHGRWLWIFREVHAPSPLTGAESSRTPPPRWFVHGLWA
jgi:protein ImuB